VTVQFSPYFIDNYIGTKISEFTSADVPDASGLFAEEPYWLFNFILNSSLRAEVASPQREYRFHYLRRATSAFSEYGAARVATLKFVAATTQTFRPYFDALDHWEGYLGSACHALRTLAAIGGQKNVFDDKTTDLGRLNALYNEMKHAESRIENGQMPERGTSPVWLTNDGLESTDARLGYGEAFEILRLVGRYAHALEDPLLTAARLSDDARVDD
jgi:hypothetical protein